MDTEAEKIIAEQVKKLPPEVRDALASDGLHAKIAAIGEKHHLHIDQVGSLENEVVLVMMGLASPADLSRELVEQLSLQAADAEAVVDDVSQEIFLPIRDAMKKFTEATGTEKSVVMPSAASGASTPISISKPVSSPAPPSAPLVPKPTPAASVAKPAEMHAADLMLTQPTVSIAPKMPVPAAPTTPATSAAPAPTPTTNIEPPPSTSSGQVKPAPYKADPYREPPE